MSKPKFSLGQLVGPLVPCGVEEAGQSPAFLPRPACPGRLGRSGHIRLAGERRGPGQRGEAAVGVPDATTRSARLYKTGVGKRPDKKGTKPMGLTIHYGLTSTTRSTPRAMALVEQMRQLAVLDLPSSRSMTRCSTLVPTCASVPSTNCDPMRTCSQPFWTVASMWTSPGIASKRPALPSSRWRSSRSGRSRAPAVSGRASVSPATRQRSRSSTPPGTMTVSSRPSRTAVRPIGSSTGNGGSGGSTQRA